GALTLARVTAHALCGAGLRGRARGHRSRLLRHRRGCKKQHRYSGGKNRSLRSLVHSFSPCSAVRKSCWRLPSDRTRRARNGRLVWYSVTRSKSYTEPSFPSLESGAGNFSSLARYLLSVARSPPLLFSLRSLVSLLEQTVRRLSSFQWLAALLV